MSDSLANTVNRIERPMHPGLALVIFLVVAVLVHAPHTLLNLADRNQDFDQHVSWPFQFYKGLGAGAPYPRWTPLGNSGMGEPALLYYSPLFYYLASAVHIAVASTWTALRVIEVGATALLGFYCWLFLRRWMPPVSALWGALACMATPMVFMLFHYFNGFPWASNAACFAALCTTRWPIATTLGAYGFRTRSPLRA